MAELIILGSGSGFATKDRFCTSIACLVEENLYLFDCGEPCSALLFRHGIDPLALKTVFISHMHPDHVGGLASLIFSAYLPGRSDARKFRPWSINRNDAWYRAALSFPRRGDGGSHVEETRPRIQIVMPSEAIDVIKHYLISVYLAASIIPFDLDITSVKEGVTFSDDCLRVTAIPNTHMSANFAYEKLQIKHPHLALQSYSYSVEVAGKKFVFSGDITTLDELNPLLSGVDVLIVEVAHYDPQDIGPFVKGMDVGRIVLTHIHPGLEARLTGLVEEWKDERITVAQDGMRISLNA